MNIKSQKAFTLVELVISMTIFAVFITATLSSYLFLTKTFRDTKAAKDLNSQTMNAMTIMSDEVKVYQIDYDCYQGNSHAICSQAATESSNGDSDGIISSSYLILRSPDANKRTIFRIAGSKLELLKQVFENNSWVSDSGFENMDKEPFGFKNILDKDVSIKNGKFYISPNKNPFSTENASNFTVQYQPQVTFDINFMTKSQIRAEIDLNIQTSISTRFYGR